MAALNLSLPGQNSNQRAQEHLDIITGDGQTLAATLFRPPPDRDRRLCVQIHSATAVTRGIYTNYGRFLAAAGCTALSFDYRGTGDSLRGSLRSCDDRMLDWGEYDLPAVTAWMAERFPHHRHTVVAHSVGGQILGLSPSCDRFDAVFGVCVQWGSWKNWPAPRRWLHKVLFHLAPGLISLCGYFPGRWLGMGDLPAGIGDDWMRWCRGDSYICNDRGEPYRPHYHRLRCPVRWLGFSDDPVFGPRKAIEAMPALYPNAQHGVEILHPADIGATAVGHFGFFRSRFRDTLWQQSLDWLVSS